MKALLFLLACSLSGCKLEQETIIFDNEAVCVMECDEDDCIVVCGNQHLTNRTCCDSVI
jgi:hypothetical protein